MELPFSVPFAVRSNQNHICKLASHYTGTMELSKSLNLSDLIYSLFKTDMVLLSQGHCRDYF